MAKKKKLPKEIAGVKIPKKVRKTGGKLLARLDTPVGRELIAAGLVAAGAAMARKAQAKTAARIGEKTKDEVEDAAELGARMAGQIGGAVAAAATAALDRFFGPAKNAPEVPPSETTH